MRSILSDTTLEDEEDDDVDDDEDIYLTLSPDDRDMSSFVFPFGPGERVVDLASRYPPVAHIPRMFELYFQRYDPIIKILHRPSVLEKFKPIMNGDTRATPGSGDEALVFAIFYGAITTLDEGECEATFEAYKETLLLRYERSLEVALTNANLLLTTELPVLQAFCVYIVSALKLRRSSS